MLIVNYASSEPKYLILWARLRRGISKNEKFIPNLDLRNWRIWRIAENAQNEHGEQQKMRTMSNFALLTVEIVL